MTGPPFVGVGVALVTLFADDGSLDAPATAAHAALLVELGIRAVVVAGSTGEAAALSSDERDDLLAAVRAAVQNVPVLAGAGAPSSRQAVAYTRAAVDLGADGLLVLSPPGVDDVRPYYDAVRGAAGDTPVLAYHYPKVSAPGIPVDALPDLPIDGCKDSTGDATRMLHALATWNGPFYTGSSAVLALAGPLGCAGAILALANAEPARCIAAFAGDARAQRDLARSHLEAAKRFPAGIKGLTATRLGTSPVARMG